MLQASSNLLPKKLVLGSFCLQMFMLVGFFVVVALDNVLPRHVKRLNSRADSRVIISFATCKEMKSLSTCEKHGSNGKYEQVKRMF